jgi:hypothetical protein
MNMIRVRIRATGQVLDMAPAPARAMILGRTAEQVSPQPRSSAPESAALAGMHENAVARTAPAAKPRGRRVS